MRILATLRRAAATAVVCVTAVGVIAPDAGARTVVQLDFSFVRTADVVAQRGPISLQQAVAIARQRYRGRVVRAETIQRNGQRFHEVRILDEEGRVRTFVINADTGE